VKHHYTHLRPLATLALSISSNSRLREKQPVSRYYTRRVDQTTFILDSSDHLQHISHITGVSLQSCLTPQISTQGRGLTDADHDVEKDFRKSSTTTSKHFAATTADSQLVTATGLVKEEGHPIPDSKSSSLASEKNSTNMDTLRDMANGTR